MMLISVCGTPCSGKTTSSGLMRKKGWEVRNDGEIIRDLSLFQEEDADTEELVVDIDDVRIGFERWSKSAGPRTILEGHLSYLAPFDICFVLRLDPTELKKRLDTRGYSNDKVMDNLESEVLGYVSIRSMEEFRRRTGTPLTGDLDESLPLLLERDVTGMTPEDICDWFRSVIDDAQGERLYSSSIYRPGSIDFLEAYSEWF